MKTPKTAKYIALILLLISPLLTASAFSKVTFAPAVPCEGHQLGLKGDVNGDCAIDFLCSAALGNLVYVIAGTDAPILGDMNCDCTVSVADVDSFVLAMLDGAGYLIAHPGCDIQQADVNGDLVIDGIDVSGFTALLAP